MRLLLLLLLFFTSMVQAHDELDYKTNYLFVWTGNCTHRLIPTYERQGMPWNFAFSMASQGCSCVIDKFREQYTQTEVMALTDAEREERSLYFAQVCSGITKEM
jgi:hypothetical protein